MYEPKPLPRSVESAVVEEFNAIAKAARDPVDYVLLNVLYAAPKRPRPGMMVEADGTHWDPGSGAGTYIYRGSAWVKLG